MRSSGDAEGGHGKSARVTAGSLDGSVLIVNGHRLRLGLLGGGGSRGSTHGSAFSVFLAGDIVRVRWFDAGAVSDADETDDDCSERNSDDDKDHVATALVRKDFDPDVHEKIAVSWWYKTNEISVSTTGVPSDCEVLCTDLDQIDPACVVDRCTNNLRLLPSKISNRLYNRTKGLLEQATASRPRAPDFKFVKQLLQLRIAARTKLNQCVTNPAMRGLKPNQIAVSVECLHQGLHAFDRSHPAADGDKLKTPDLSQQIAAWALCFGPVLVGDALWQMQQLVSFDSHKDA
jgi:hypothetical protein